MARGTLKFFTKNAVKYPALKKEIDMKDKKKGYALAKVAKLEGESLKYQAKESLGNKKASPIMRKEAKVIIAKDKAKKK
jgi:hypothetical protein